MVRPRPAPLFTHTLVHDDGVGIILGGLELYRNRPDKGYSLTDCISMETMRREALAEILTNDRHFEQEGFSRLLKPN